MPAVFLSKLLKQLRQWLEGVMSALRSEPQHVIEEGSLVTPDVDAVGVGPKCAAHDGDGLLVVNVILGLLPEDSLHTKRAYGSSGVLVTSRRSAVSNCPMVTVGAI